MNDRFSLSGRRILVTGASAGIGREVCRSVAALGGMVVGSGRDEGRLGEMIGSLSGEGHRMIRADLRVPEERGFLVEETGEIDGFVYAAGALLVRPFLFTKPETLRSVQEINYEVPVLLVQELLKKRRIAEGGSLLFVTSVAAAVGAKGHALYGASKAALTAAARTLALELGGRGIRVNCLAPGMVRTAMAAEAEEFLSSEAMRRHEQEYPLGFGSPEDVASAASFLLSDAARWITGTTLTVDGGFSAG